MDSRIVTMDLHSHVIEKKVKGKDYWKHAGRLGIDVMAITEHAHFDTKKAFERVNREKTKNKLLVPGVELNTAIGHVLCYSPDDRVYSLRRLHEFEIPIEEALDIAKANGMVLSCAHPWGYTQDSAAFLIGPKKLAVLVRKHPLGIEAFNGMIGHLGDIVYESGWVRRPNNFLSFLQKNRVTRKIGAGRVGEQLQKSLDRMVYSYLNRITASIELGELASFITAGSDAHSPDRIGEGMLKMRTKNEITNAADVLELIQRKQDVVWCGMGVTEISPGVYKKISPHKIKRMELVEGIKYMAMQKIRQKVIADNKKRAQSRRGPK
ncbi:MAG: PHP-associated domain-containing protein [Candidatus Diapherotrites archaeon]|nr:PHP-associated domain-containing protein [Candidatus Diapherotrites archaeon]